MADSCVKCGLCLPHCPTYLIYGLEGESPRGRIALVEGLASGALPAAGNTVRHLENCTGCLACESVCPAGVSVGRLIDEGRAELRRRGRRRNIAARWLSALARRPRLTGALLKLLRLGRRLGAPGVGSALGIDRYSAFGRVLARLPSGPIPASGDRSPPGDESRGTVMLFSGCVSSCLDRRTLDDAIFVLRGFGYQVSIPSTQDCCGAIDLHDGEPERAVRLASRNCSAFGPGDEPILTLASGCAATLYEYDRLAPGGGERFCSRLRELTVFLESGWKGGTLAALPLRVALFSPCTVRNRVDGTDSSSRLLGRIPELQLQELGTGFGCCGAAGHHFITRARQADRLLAPITEEIERLDPDVVTIANVGCALHLAGALRAAGCRAEVLHPVSVLRRSLEGAA